jgi:hypothetical protein
MNRRLATNEGKKTKAMLFACSKNIFSIMTAVRSQPLLIFIVRDQNLSKII